MTNTSEFIQIENHDGVGIIRLNRPKVNALNVQMQKELAAAAEAVAADPQIAAVVITGNDRAFAAGVDIVEMNAMTAADMAAHVDVMHGAYDAVARIPKPVIAAVSGFALGGGCELSLCADVRFAADTAVFGQPEIKLGIIPGAGGTQRLTRLVGPSKAKDMIFTGRFVKADEALAIGLADQVFPADEVLDKAMAWARQFVGQASVALAAAKRAVDFGTTSDLTTGLMLERAEFTKLFGTQDRTIGMTSFVENGPGKAEFVGR